MQRDLAPLAPGGMKGLLSIASPHLNGDAGENQKRAQGTGNACVPFPIFPMPRPSLPGAVTTRDRKERSSSSCRRATYNLHRKT